MAAPASREERFFFDVFESLPRQGPGSLSCTARAFESCRELPPAPAVVDLGCGTGAQTLHLSELTPGTIVALDLHAPSLERLSADVVERGLERRVLPVVGDLARPPLRPGGFDLVWSEGALYAVGLERGLALCRSLLRPGGRLAFTDAVWRVADPPAEVRASFEEYPTMGSVAEALARIASSGFELADHFPLPDEAWWDAFYSPMLRRVEELREAHANDAEALAALEEIASEPEMHRRHGHSYGYEFFVARRA